MTWKKLLAPPIVVGLFLLIAASALFGMVRSSLQAHLIKQPIHAPGGRQVSAIPAETANWIREGPDRREAEMIEGVLGTTNYLNRLYVKKSTRGTDQPKYVDLHLAYYTGMIDTVPHVPERCMVGGGWSIVGATKDVRLALRGMIEIPDMDVPESMGRVTLARIATPGGPMSGARVRLPEGMDRIDLRVTPFATADGRGKLYAGYFFIANGGIATTAEQVRLLAFDLRSKYAYYLKVQVASPMVSSPEELGQLAEELLSELLPEIMLCVPDWIDVRMGLYPPETQQSGVSGTVGDRSGGNGGSGG
ncbi:MAG: exosortase-associated EpsI family protein [Phycisphaeraceae bacterium]|nr:exosortase-associated EpsI family protein [Phycisphaeraceae bacterium]